MSRGRLTDDQRAARLAEAQELARQRATQWRVFIVVGKDTVEQRIVDAGSEEAAQRLLEAPNGRRLKRPPVIINMRPLLGSRSWRRIYEEVGLA